MKPRSLAHRPPQQPSDVVGPKGLGYRPDIDGLRGIAVLAVLFFHYDIGYCPGGFAGVDVFFVISGYLITAILTGELVRGDFSLLGFYERRLRRIAPALFVMLAVCAALAPFVFLPDDLRAVGDGILNAALAKSNFFFETVADDYFAAGKLDVQPVLHTWSLAVEAQFYVVFPGLLLALRWLSWPTWRALLCLAVISFAASLWGTAAAPVATFYLLPTRAWELLAGGLLVCPVLERSLGFWRAPGLSWFGLALIVASAVMFTPTTPFPGLAAAVPVLGAALLLRSGARDAGRPNRVLGLRPLRFVGRISYSLYLWHWPILVFAAYRSAGPLDLPARLGLLALSFGVATLSCWAVEQPVLRRRTAARRTGVTLAVSIAVALMTVQGGILLKRIGRGADPFIAVPPDVAALIDAEKDMLRTECRPQATQLAVDFPCRFGAGEPQPRLALWGNSFARMWAPALDIAARAHDVSGVSFLLSYCLPLLGVDSPMAPDCAAFNARVLETIRAHPEFQTIVLGGNWYAAGSRIDALGPTVRTLEDLGRRVVVVLEPPEAGFSVPHALALAALRHAPPPPPRDETAAKSMQRPTEAVIEALSRRDGFTVIDPATWLCDGQHCDIARDGIPLYFDDRHISVAGARMAAGLFGPIFTSEPP